MGYANLLPEQGGSRKGMGPFRQRNGSHESKPSSVKPMEVFSMVKLINLGWSKPGDEIPQPKLMVRPKATARRAIQG